MLSIIELAVAACQQGDALSRSYSLSCGDRYSTGGEDEKLGCLLKVQHI
jgi:hypothetical protein